MGHTTIGHPVHYKVLGILSHSPKPEVTLILKWTLIKGSNHNRHQLCDTVKTLLSCRNNSTSNGVKDVLNTKLGTTSARLFQKGLKAERTTAELTQIGRDVFTRSRKITDWMTRLKIVKCTVTAVVSTAIGAQSSQSIPILALSRKSQST